MRVISARDSDPSAAAACRPARSFHRTVVEPQLPALLRCTTFFLTLATPFVVALLTR